MKIKGLFKNQHGYLMIRFEKKIMPAHKFLWEWYYDKKVPRDMEVHHKDRDITNNTIENLELKTKVDNLSSRKFKNRGR